MSTEVVTAEASVAPHQTSSRSLGLRVSCWGIALLLGAAQAWATRFSMNPDGVSYLDIGDAYWRRDWHNAINAYWSPLYSWILGFFPKVLKPSMYWEYPLVHFVNFLIYVGSLACFEFFLAAFIADRKRHNQKLLANGQMGLPEACWWLLGYSLFLSCCCSPIVMGAGLVSPDMCVAAFVFLASGLVLRICAGASHGYIALGMVLGLAYLAKSIMFPLGFVFLLVLVLDKQPRWKQTLVSAAIFLAIAAPFIATISRSKGHLTIGESARWNYLVFIDGVRPFFPQAGPPAERPRRILESPNVYDYSHMLNGTYPPWIDPSYWQDGLKARFESRNQLLAIVRNLREYWHYASDTLLQLGFTIGFIMLGFFFATWEKRSFQLQWRTLAPALVAFSAYAVLLVQFRYISPFVVLLWLSLFSSLKFTSTQKMRNMVRFTLVCSCSVALIAPSALSVMALFVRDAPVYWEAASHLREGGVKPGDAIALIWNDDWENGAAGGSFVMRLMRAHAVGEAEPARIFWAQSAGVQSKVIRALFTTGAKAILARRPPAGARVSSCWQPLGSSGFYTCMPDPNSK